jgi:hypothetical protein
MRSTTNTAVKCSSLRIPRVLDPFTCGPQRGTIAGIGRVVRRRLAGVLRDLFASKRRHCGAHG